MGNLPTGGFETPILRLGDRRIGPGAPVYIVAELSANHNGDLGRAHAVVDAAAASGADAVKLQTYRADSLTLDHDSPPFIIDGGTPWDGRKLHDLYEQAAMPLEWTAELFAHGQSLGLDVFSTPFDDAAVRLLEPLDPPAYKVASFELVDHGLLRSVGATRKPVILSTGMATMDEIDEAVTVLQEAGADGIALLRCNSAYPADATEMDLRSITAMRERWPLPIGLSDHTLGNTAALLAVALGACMIEKHLCIQRSDGGPDSGFSLEPAEFADLVHAVREAEATLGSVRFGPSPSEAPSRVFRRSLFVVEDVPAGAALTQQNVRAIRPGTGLAPRFLPEVLGRTVRAAVRRGTPVGWDLLAEVP